VITGDKVVLLDWNAAPELVGQVGTVMEWREVGNQLHNMTFEYLVKFDNGIGMYLWIPARFLRGL
jgi:hypothetical protein